MIFQKHSSSDENPNAFFEYCHGDFRISTIERYDLDEVHDEGDIFESVVFKFVDGLPKPIIIFRGASPVVVHQEACDWFFENEEVCGKVAQFYGIVDELSESPKAEEVVELLREVKNFLGVFKQ